MKAGVRPLVVVLKQGVLVFAVPLPIEPRAEDAGLPDGVRQGLVPRLGQEEGHQRGEDGQRAEHHEGQEMRGFRVQLRTLQTAIIKS